MDVCLINKHRAENRMDAEFDNQMLRVLHRNCGYVSAFAGGLKRTFACESNSLLEADVVEVAMFEYTCFSRRSRWF